MRRTTVLSLLATLSLSAAVEAQQEPEAKQALDQLVNTVSNAKTISYQVNVVGVGRWFSMLPTTRGEVVAARPDDNPKAWKMRITGKSEGVGVDPTNILVVTDPTKWAWVDEPARQVVERYIGQERGNVVDAANAIRIREMFDSQPMSKELKCEVMKMEPSVELDGVKCDVVYVDQGKDLPKGRWFIGPEHLPRKVEQIIQGGGLDDKRVWTLTKVKLDADPPAGSFAISTPEGFTYSPAAQPTPPPATSPFPMPTKVLKRERPVGPNMDELAPDFELATASGEKIRLFSFRGSVVVLDFWGTWNMTSKKSTALVQALATKYKDKGVKFLGLSVREGTDAAPVKFFKDNNLTYTLLLKADESAKAYHVKRYPTMFILGKEGEIIAIAGNYDDKTVKDIEAKIDAALAAGATDAAKADGAADATPRTKAQPEAPAGKPR